MKDTKIATVDEKGHIKAVKAGETELIATIAGIEYKVPVTVK